MPKSSNQIDVTPARHSALRTLILIPCSQRKRTEPPTPVPAVERYDGPLYRVLRKALRAGYVSPTTDVAILSAKYGLLDMITPIPFYDQKMTTTRAVELAPQIKGDLRRLLAARRYAQIRINLGRAYAALLDGVAGIKDAEWATGSIGVRAATLKAWLHDGAAPAATRAGQTAVADGK